MVVALVSCNTGVEFRVNPPALQHARAPANAPGIRHVTFAVEDLDYVLARLRAHGAELVDEVEQYENIFRLCYIRGPAGIIIELAEEIGCTTDDRTRDLPQSIVEARPTTQLQREVYEQLERDERNPAHPPGGPLRRRESGERARRESHAKGEDATADIPGSNASRDLDGARAGQARAQPVDVP
jgi:hypothetical protein